MFKRNLSLLSLLLLSSALSSLAWDAAKPTAPAAVMPIVSPEEVGMESATLAEIAEIVQGYWSSGQLAGAVTLAAKDGRIVHLGAVGDADVAGRRPMRTDSMFAIASMTKPITATALMILVDEGKVDLEAPVAKYVPSFQNASLPTGSPRRPITVKDVLTHTAGLVGDQQVVGSLQQSVDELAGRPLGFEPGSKWQYSPGLNVCGRIIEVASDMPYEQFLAERIFGPLGMTDTTFHPTEVQRLRVARLYQPGSAAGALEPATHWINEISDERPPNPSGGLFSTATDMARFYQMVLNGGELDGRRIVSKESVRKMTSIQTGDLVTGFTPGHGWGLGWCVVREPQGVSSMLSPGTFGHGGAFGTQGWVDPKRRMIFVLMIQRTGFGNSDGSDPRQRFQQTVVDALRE